MTGVNDWGPVIDALAQANWTAILVPVIPGVAAIVGPLFLWYRQSKRESSSVRAGLLAEVAALVEIVERRGFLPALREKQRLLAFRSSSAAAAFRRDPESFEVRIDSHFNRVYQANVSKLGVLTADEAKQIVRFHQLADSVRIDVTAGVAWPVELTALKSTRKLPICLRWLWKSAIRSLIRRNHRRLSDKLPQAEIFHVWTLCGRFHDLT
ncbi:hypothetical protein [Pseudomonas koreensis]|uniref:Uncharacterized protein n=1 Tax=Pseudomonas koreensis TaxID=198620 RepID=A0AA94EQA3_9PSED|nr:hypothetical protein [Pseudomonas koreensis]RVD78455.1 hypothetical protein A9HBioS_1641 [Pseudomonas koreensis]